MGFFPFLSSLPISSSVRKALRLCLAISFLTFIQLVFDLLAFTDNNKVIDQIITDNREITNKLYLQRNEPTNMTNLPSSIPLALFVDFALKVTSLMTHKYLYIFS